MEAVITGRPSTFDRVDRVKLAVGEPVLPGDDEEWILGGPMLVTINGTAMVIPKGFTTDGASIPRLGTWLTGWTRWDPPQRWAAIVHDWLYRVPGASRKYADLAFRAVLRSEGASWFRAEIMYLAVRLGGILAYRNGQIRGPRIYNK